MTEIGVHLDAPDGVVAVGTARVDRHRGATTTRFRYHDAYLAGPGWALSPDLPVTSVEGLLAVIAHWRHTATERGITEADQERFGGALDRWLGRGGTRPRPT
ncbi:MAG: hypothetical protein AB7L84_12945 [Acidimicrobiia bacterium]